MPSHLTKYNWQSAHLCYNITLSWDDESDHTGLEVCIHVLCIFALVNWSTLLISKKHAKIFEWSYTLEIFIQILYPALCGNLITLKLNQCNELGAPMIWWPVTTTWTHGRSPHLHCAKWDLSRSAVVSVRIRTDVATCEFKYPSWHGFKARRQQLASQRPGEPTVVTWKCSKIFKGGQRITIPSKLRHMHYIARCVVIKVLKTTHTHSGTEDYLPKQNLECLPYG